MSLSWSPPPRDQEAAERLVAASLGPEASIVAWEPMEPSAVARLVLTGSGTASFVLKWLRSDRLGWRTEPSQVLTEGVALGYLGRLAPGLVPRLIGFDPRAGLVLMEDLAPRRPLLELLRDRDPSAPAGLTAFARAMGDLHSLTAGRAEEYYRRRREHGPVDPLRERRRFFWEPRWNPETIGAQLGAPMSSQAHRDLQEAMASLAEPGPFLALSNGDSGTNNYLLDQDDGRIIDFEFAGFRHCLTDVACLYVPGPQWMAVADPDLDGTEAAYRRATAAAIPEAEDDAAYGEGVAAAGLLYALMRLGRLAMLDDRPHGHESRRQMVSTLYFAQRTASRFGELAGLVGWVESLASALRRRWPDADIDVDQLAPYSRRV